MNSRLSGKQGGFEVCKPIQHGAQIKGIGTQRVIFSRLRGRAGIAHFLALQPVLRGRDFCLPMRRRQTTGFKQRSAA